MGYQNTEKNHMNEIPPPPQHNLSEEIVAVWSSVPSLNL